MVLKHNLKKHEHIGLFLIFLGATWLGFAIYGTLLAANRAVIPSMPLIKGKEMFIFPLFYGIGALLTMLGTIELREVLPGKNRTL